ncbi:hypothetical protein ACTXT7_006418 [Hymenolepis weldensis]
MANITIPYFTIDTELPMSVCHQMCVRKNFPGYFNIFSPAVPVMFSCKFLPVTETAPPTTTRLHALRKGNHISQAQAIGWSFNSIHFNSTLLKYMILALRHRKGKKVCWTVVGIFLE